MSIKDVTKTAFYGKLSLEKKERMKKLCTMYYNCMFPKLINTVDTPEHKLWAKVERAFERHSANLRQNEACPFKAVQPCETCTGYWIKEKKKDAKIVDWNEYGMCECKKTMVGAYVK